MSPITELIGGAKAYGWGSFAAASDFESIATVTGNGSATFLDLTNIPSTYDHLQIRIFAQPAGSGGGTTSPVMRVNNDTATNYTEHSVLGNGSSTEGRGGANGTYWNIGFSPQGSGAGVYSAFVMDILDYANTDKFKVMRSLGGYDSNGGGFVALASGLWRSTSAITDLRFYVNDGLNLSWNTGSRISLYGMKGAA